MPATLKLDILTPTGALEGGQGLEVSGVEVPGLLGEVGVLPGHIPFVTAIVPGVVHYRTGQDSVRLAVGSGFLEVSGQGRVSILTQRALRSQDIDAEALRPALLEAEAELKQAQEPLGSAAYVKLEQRYRWLDAQVRAAG
ncbi:MAG: ATP synthase F1 subunit epsilon [Nannocystaceae bacterium]